MEPELSAVLDVLNHINDEIRLTHYEGPLLKLVTDGRRHRIKFHGKILWKDGQDICLYFNTREGLQRETLGEALFRMAYGISNCIQDDHKTLSSTPHGILLNSRIELLEVKRGNAR